MTNVLIPTDFSVASVFQIEKAVEALGVKPFHAILFHAFQIPTLNNDLHGITRPAPYSNLLDDSFRMACRQVKQQYSKQVKSIVIKHMFGSTAAVFRNFVDANDIDIIYLPEDYFFTSVHPDSVNPVPLFKRSGIPVLKVRHSGIVQKVLAHEALKHVESEKLVIQEKLMSK